MKIQSFFASHVGNYRKENQDSFLCLRDENFYAVADGMGGHKNGALASYLAIQKFSEFYFQAIDEENSIVNLKHIIKDTHQYIYNENLKENNNHFRDQMGTTGVILKIDEYLMEYIVSWCGDSRLYHYKFNEKQLIQITKDHSKIQQLLDNHLISKKTAKKSNEKNILTDAIGIGETQMLTIDEAKHSFNHNDILLLCSDGLTNELNNEDIKKELENNNGSIQQKTENLIIKSLKNGGKDNITVGLIVFKNM